MQFELQLATHIASIAKVSGVEIPLTPLLGKLFVERAIDLAQNDQPLTDLPTSAAEAYFDYIRLLLAKNNVSQIELILKLLGEAAKLCLGDRYVASKVSKHQVVDVFEKIVGDNTYFLLNTLVTSGILVEEPIALHSVLFFALDPLAEFCAADAYIRQFGMDEKSWEGLVNRLNKLGGAALGFRNALIVTVKLYLSKGAVSPMALEGLTAI